MTLEKKRIAILFHAKERGNPLSGFMVDHLADIWREDGYEVIYLFGVDEFVPADLLLVHVDLSVVPDEYLTFASRYPVSLNSKVGDIRKSKVSSNIIKRGDNYDGPVIVKSNLNFGGQPEERLSQNWLQRHDGFLRRIGDAIQRFGKGTPPIDLIYPVYDNLADVPEKYLDREDLIVERFLPERENGLFMMHICLVLGDRLICRRIGSPDPVFKASSSVCSEVVDVHPAVVSWRETYGLDYGKFDYLVHESGPVLIDINKTIGASRQVADSPQNVIRRELAQGLYSFLR